MNQPFWRTHYDPDKTQRALEDFSNSLPEKPKWTVLIAQDNGQLLARVGELPYFGERLLTQAKEVEHVYKLGMLQLESFKALENGNFQLSYHGGGNGGLFIVNLLDFLFLAISYKWIGTQSLDKTEEAIYQYFQPLVDAFFF